VSKSPNQQIDRLEANPRSSLDPDDSACEPLEVESKLGELKRPVVAVASLAPDGAPKAIGPDLMPGASAVVAKKSSLSRKPFDGDTRRIYTRTLAELYAGQGGIEKAIEVYRKLVSDDPKNLMLAQRLNELENTESGGRPVVSMKSLAPDVASPGNLSSRPSQSAG
jgi:predicted Zn-dependent protease